VIRGQKNPGCYMEFISRALFSAELYAPREICACCEGLSGEERRSATGGLMTVWTACPPRGMAARICIHLGQDQLRPLASAGQKIG
jgi:hypothetical protein